MKNEWRLHILKSHPFCPFPCWRNTRKHELSRHRSILPFIFTPCEQLASRFFAHDWLIFGSFLKLIELVWNRHLEGKNSSRLPYRYSERVRFDEGGGFPMWFDIRCSNLLVLVVRTFCVHTNAYTQKIRIASWISRSDTVFLIHGIKKSGWNNIDSVPNKKVSQYPIQGRFYL